MRYTDVLKRMEPVEKRVSKQEGGTHADEIETSTILYMSPEDCDMSKAVNDDHPGPGPLTRDAPRKDAVYSATGVFGDATLATREKGRIVTEALVEAIVAEIEALRAAPLSALVAPSPVR
jgi:creatinine amidohydrolase